MFVRTSLRLVAPITHPFAVNRHHSVVRNAEVLHLGNTPDALGVSGVAPSAEDNADTCSRIGVVGRNESSGGIVDQGGECHRDVVLL